MKKNFLTTSILAAGVMSAAVSANAAIGDVKVYAGAGVNYNFYGVNSATKTNLDTTYKATLKTNGLGLSPILGFKFHENFGAELGYEFNKKFKFSNTQTTIPKNAQPAAVYTVSAQTIKTKVNNMYLDLIGFMPVSDQIEIIGGLGIAKFKQSAFAINITDPATGTAADAGKEISNYNKFSATSKVSLRAKIGAQYNFNSNLGARITAVYQHIGKKQQIKNIKTIGLGVFYTF